MDNLTRSKPQIVKKKRSPTRAFLPGFTLVGPTIYAQSSEAATNYAAAAAATASSRQASSSTASSSTSTRPPNPCSSSTLGPLSPSCVSPIKGSIGDEDSPDLIIITSWTGAIPKHTAKYIKSYNSLFPGTPILIITTTISDLAVHSTKTKIKTLAPAVEFLCRPPTTAADILHNTIPPAAGFTLTPSSSSTLPRTPAYTNILLHAFSEGGANKAVCLAQAFLAATNHTSPLPIAAFVFDSTPGTPRYSSNVAAFSRSLPPNKLAQAVGLPIGASVLAVTWVLFSIVVGYDNNLISKTRRALNDPTLWKVAGVPRTYLFSEADDLIRWQDVEEHGLASARDLGVKSLLVRFKSTGHCGHARGNEELYWRAVRRTWDAREGAKGGVKGVEVENRLGLS